VTATWLTDLEAAVPGRIRTSQSDRDQHGRDSAHAVPQPPDAVAYPTTTDEVAALMRVCARHGRPVIPFGVGSSLERHVTAPFGGLSLDLSAMNRILEVHAEDMDARVEAGVTREQLNADLRDQGLFFPIDPGANATLGGMAATRASGTNAVRYGTMRGNVMGLTVVTPEGEVIRTGGRARKSSAGYDLTALYVGSEGTLGIITEVHLRLYPVPERIAAAVVQFTTLRDAVESVIETLQLGVPIARIELLDELQMRAVNARAQLGFRNAPTLFLEFHGGPASVDEQIATVRAVMEGRGGSDFQWADRQEDRTRLWKARHDAFWAAKDLRPGTDVITTDVCVPISRLADCVLETRADLDGRGLIAPIVGHVGDGNFHCVILYDADSEVESRTAAEAHEALILRALAMGGTCTGEHGIGAGKREYLLREHGTGVASMRRLKQALDPRNLMNPGKIFLD
jgi:D-lactate dehydrogenase (cytochrome)